jgi:UDP-GlcNAc3NAcA epimerase
MKIVSIVGARPQFVKLAPFSQEVRRYHNEIIIHTGQHYNANMSDLFFSELNIPEPDYNLNIGSDHQGAQTGRMLTRIEEVLLKEEPDLLVVFGDTNSTLAGALAAVKLHIPTVHIEAGLRSFNRLMPEEINRVLSDHACDFLFAPTETAVNNLVAEGLSAKSYFTGDIMVDSLRMALTGAEKRTSILSENSIKQNEYYLLTLHRPQNVDNELYLSTLLQKLNQLDKTVVFPVHPRTKKVLSAASDSDFRNVYSNIRFIEPLSYLDFLCMQQNSCKILTDSGGIQKEAYILQKPCLTIRDETEWLETVDVGWNRLINPNQQDFIELIIAHNPPESHPEIFGSNVSEKIVEQLNSILK